jgi:hypothetical protein
LLHHGCSVTAVFPAISEGALKNSQHPSKSLD